jgi:cytidylate kinase
MQIDLSKYLTERYRESQSRQDFDGPIVTIAREFGCPAKKIAAELVIKLNELKSPVAKKMEWRWVSKEILSESAKELEVDPKEIKYIFEYQKKSVFDEILSSHSRKYYKSDRVIRKTIAKVIRNIANEGNVVIVGRGGVAITRDIEKSFHVQLEAPLEWRAMRVSEKFCMSIEEAKKYSCEIDKKRQEFRDFFHGKGSDYSSYDVKFNCMTFTIEEIIQAIIRMMQLRKLI